MKQEESMESREILTIAEVAQKLDISTKTAYNLVKFGKLKVIKIGSHIKVPKLALRDYIRENSNMTEEAFELTMDRMST